MSLTEFIEQNDIKCADVFDFCHTPEFYKMKEFEKRCYRINNIPCLMPETYEVRTFDVRLNLQNEIERFLFFRRYDLIDNGRYWLNRDLKRCLVDEGKVISID